MENPSNPPHLVHALQERVKELTVLYRVGHLVQENRAIPDILQSVVSLLPSACQYPDITAAQIEFDEQTFKTPHFKQTPWHLKKDFTTTDNKKGALEICYLKRMPQEAEGPFLAEEKDLLLAITETIKNFLDRKETEEKLRDREERFRSAFENAPIGMSLLSPQGHWIRVNQALCQIMGYSEQELLEMAFQALTHPDDLEKDVRALQDMLDGKINTYQVEKRFIHKSGQEIWILKATSLIRDSQGNPLYQVAQIEDITRRKKAEETLHLRQDQLRALSHRLVEIQERERRNIAHALHDDVGQSLTLAKVHLQTISHEAQTEQLCAQLKTCTDIIEEALQRVRHISVDLRPSVLDDLGLAAAVRSYVYKYAQQGGFTAQVICNLQDNALPSVIETTCFRIVQEALTNIMRHAQAQDVTVDIHQKDNALHLQIKDNGTGFDMPHIQKQISNSQSLGLLGMQERVSWVEGQIDIHSAPNQGTQISVQIPLT